jgi:hypothetical protein
LFKIRNEFTHNTYSRGPILGFNEHNDWHFRETVYKGNYSYWISTSKKFEEQLKTTILSGIVTIINTENKEV